MENPQESLLNDFEQPSYTYVGFWPRFGALFLDGILITVFNLVTDWMMPEKNNLVLIVLFGSVPLFYHLILEYHYGATVGKMALGIRIVSYELKPPTFQHIFLRNLIYLVIQAGGIAIEIQTMYGNSESQLDMFSSPMDLFSTPAVVMALVLAVSVFVIYLIELIFLLTDEKYRSLHDRIGKTYVVKKLF